MIKAGVYGATGYAGFELVKILLRHLAVGADGIRFTTSESSAGGKLSDVYPCPYDYPLIGAGDAPLDDVDVAFLCLPHTASMDAVRRVRAAGVVAIDLSADFRIHDATTYETWYKAKHTAPELLAEAVYGLPELHRAQIRTANLIANPGCYPTGIILGLYPLVKAGLLGDRRVICDSKSGVSGAGRSLKLGSMFVEVNENFSPYKIGHAHQHIGEMEQELNEAGAGGIHMTFSPHLLPVNNGILSTIYASVRPGWNAEQLLNLYRETYQGEPFLHILAAGQVATLRHTVGTNRVAIGIMPAGREGEVIITTSEDNLIKGAAGQAVQNMNVRFGLPETAGLL